MRQLTDGRQARRAAPVLPTWRYWVIALVLAPALTVAGVVLSLETGVVWGLPAIGVAVLTAAAVLGERHVRLMPPPWRAVWVAVGVLLGAAVGYGSMAVTFFVVCSLSSCFS